MKKKLILVGVSLGILFSPAFLILCSNWNEAVVRIRNESGVEIEKGELELSSLQGGKSFAHVKNGEEVVVGFKNFGDGCYILKLKFKDGSELIDSAGYVTNGADYKDRFVIQMANGKPVAVLRQNF